MLLYMWMLQLILDRQLLLLSLVHQISLHVNESTWIGPIRYSFLLLTFEAAICVAIVSAGAELYLYSHAIIWTYEAYMICEILMIAYRGIHKSGSIFRKWNMSVLLQSGGISLAILLASFFVRLIVELRIGNWDIVALVHRWILAAIMHEVCMGSISS